MSITRKFSVAAVPLMAVSMALVGCDLGLSTNDATTNNVTPANSQEPAFVAVTNDVDSSDIVQEGMLLPKGTVNDSIEIPGRISDTLYIPSDLVDSIFGNDTLVVIPVPASVSASGCFEPWFGYEGIYRIYTGYDNGSESSGYWFYYNDAADGGLSQIIWPAPMGNDYSTDAFDNIIDVCYGVCGTYALDKGSLEYDPFVGVGFTFAGMKASGEIQMVDASAISGIRVQYSSEVSLSVEMGFDSEMEAALAYDVPTYSLTSTGTGITKTVDIPWSKFRQAGWGRGLQMTGEQGALTLGTIKFKVQGKDGLTGAFNIVSVEALDRACSSTSTATPVTPVTPVIPETSSSVIPPMSSSSVIVVNNSNFVTWDGADGIERIETGFDAGMETSGYWFDYSDETDGGLSNITWPVERGNEYVEDSFQPVIDHCSGLCGTYTLNKGTLDYQPFVGVGFYLAGEDENGHIAAVDATAMGGVCIVYTSDMSATLEMSLGDDGDREIGYDVPSAMLPKGESPIVKNIAWSQFKQAGWGRTYISGEDAAIRLAALKFKIQGTNGSTGDFNIISIGSYGNCSYSGDVLP